MKLEDIELRMTAIKTEIETEGADIAALSAEVDQLIDERKQIEQSVEERTRVLNTIASNTVAPVIATAPEPTLRKIEDNTMEYRTAFLKNLIGMPLNEAEERAYTHTTANTAAVIPKELQDKIYSTMEEKHPLLADVQVLRTGAVLSIVKHTAIVAGDAKDVAEGVANDDEQNTFVNVTLAGKDFSKHVDFSYRLGNMAIPAFETYLVQEISNRLGAAMAAEAWAQIKLDLAAANKFGTAAAGVVSKADILKSLSELKQVGRVNVYTNNATFYNNIATAEGAEGLISFVPNYQEQISGQLLGKPVKEEDAAADGEILFLDPDQFIWNVVQDIMLERDKDIKRHVHTISGFAIAGGTLTNDKAGVLLTVTAAG